MIGAGKEAIVGSLPVLLGVKLKMTCSHGLAQKHILSVNLLTAQEAGAVSCVQTKALQVR